MIPSNIREGKFPPYQGMIQIAGVTPKFDPIRCPRCGESGSKINVARGVWFIFNCGASLRDGKFTDYESDCYFQLQMKLFRNRIKQLEHELKAMKSKLKGVPK